MISKDYEFYSVLYQHDPQNRHKAYIEITHLSDVYNHHQESPKNTWKKSRLNFCLPENTKIELLPDTVKLEHYTIQGKLFTPNKIESTLSECKAKIGCRGGLVLHYSKGAPKTFAEKASFMLLINGIKKEFSYTIPLEYKYQYSFWDVMMGV